MWNEKKTHTHVIIIKFHDIELQKKKKILYKVENCARAVLANMFGLFLVCVYILRTIFFTFKSIFVLFFSFALLEKSIDVRLCGVFTLFFLYGHTFHLYRCDMSTAMCMWLLYGKVPFNRSAIQLEVETRSSLKLKHEKKRVWRLYE